MRLQVGVGNLIGQVVKAVVIQRAAVVITGRTHRQHIVVGEEQGFVGNREGEGDTRHHSPGGIIVLEGVDVDVLLTGILQPRGRTGAHADDGRVVDLNTILVVPGVTVTVTDDGGSFRDLVDIRNVVVADVVGHVDGSLVVEMDVAVSDIFNGIEVIKHIRVFQHILVGIEAVDTHTDVEDQVFESELVLDVTGDVDGLLGTNRAVQNAFFIGMVEEVGERRTF